MKDEVLAILKTIKEHYAKELRNEIRRSNRDPDGDSDHGITIFNPAVISIINDIIKQVKALKEKP